MSERAQLGGQLCIHVFRCLPAIDYSQDHLSDILSNIDASLVSESDLCHLDSQAIVHDNGHTPKAVGHCIAPEMNTASSNANASSRLLIKKKTKNSSRREYAGI